MVNHQQTDLINDTSNLKVRIGSRSAHVYAHVWGEGGKSMTHSMASRKNRFLI